MMPLHGADARYSLAEMHTLLPSRRTRWMGHPAARFGPLQYDVNVAEIAARLALKG
jgi:hypothetical protein